MFKILINFAPAAYEWRLFLWRTTRLERKKKICNRYLHHIASSIHKQIFLNPVWLWSSKNFSDQLYWTWGASGPSLHPSGLSLLYRKQFESLVFGCSCLQLGKTLWRASVLFQWLCSFCGFGNTSVAYSGWGVTKELYTNNMILVFKVPFDELQHNISLGSPAVRRDYQVIS